ncbi:hypothetical protein [Actinomycetospora straminea]|uniref:Uncharacterized protein n=1 Tax=Actinomycetospora straminea TaxID=663607 RepID=A0ABP9FA25_9PSEU|nr:hypothetical protein [Actinomycetospora straminea]MDD7936667.1 hypothetical protein [Actinomycetospora straminea]
MSHAAPTDARAEAWLDAARPRSAARRDRQRDGAHTGARRGARSERRVRAARVRRRPLRVLMMVLVTGLCAGVALVVLETAVADPAGRRSALSAVDPAEAVGPGPLPYGGQLERPDPADLLDPASLLGLGLLTLGLLNGLVFLGTATWDGMVAPSAAETRRRLRTRSGRGVVPGGRREVRRTVHVPAASPAASAGPAVVDVPARRSVPGRPAAGTTYAPLPDPVPAAPRRRVVAPGPVAEPVVPPGRFAQPKRLMEPATVPASTPVPVPLPEPLSEPALERPRTLAPKPVVPRRPEPELVAEPVAEPLAEPTPEPVAASTPEPVAEPAPTPEPEPLLPSLIPAPRRPSPVPRDGGDGTPARATRRGSGPWGWRPARPDPVPWRNPVPAFS